MRTTILVFSLMVAIYCMVAFVTWEFNPAEWGALTRFVAAALIFFLAPLIAMESK